MEVRIRRYLRVAWATLPDYTGLLTLLTCCRRSILGREEYCAFCLHRALSLEDCEKTHSLPVARKSGKLSFLLTFDDGWGVNSVRAFPWLKILNLPAAVP